MMNNQKNEKYEFLYQYAKSSFDDELTRFRNIEDKASKFIGLLSIMIVGYTAIIRFSGSVFFPPETKLQWTSLVVIGLTFVTLVSSWSLLFRSLRFIEMPRLPLDPKYIEDFKSKDFATNHYLLSVTCSDALAQARFSNTKKTKLLRQAYSDMTLSAWLLSVSLLLLTITSYSNNGDAAMPNNDNNQPTQQQTQSPPEPDFNATPPKMVMILDHAIPKPKSGSEQINESND